MENGNGAPMSRPSTDPYLLQGGRVGVLLIHGFTASPTELRPIADFLHALGYTALGVRLAGHGTHLNDLRNTRWQDWVDSAQTGLRELANQCDSVYVVGLSMGGVLAAHLAATQPERVHGLGLLAPAFRVQTRALWLAPLLRYVLPDIKKGARSMQYFEERGLSTYDAMPVGALAQLEGLIRATRPQLSRISQPTLVCMGMREHTVRPNSAYALWSAIGSEHKRLLFLPNSGHILSVEPDAPFLMQVLQTFLEDPAGTPPQK
jgi:carboxylesterase